MDSDAKLISRWKAGDNSALEELLRHHESGIYGYLFKMLNNNRHDAEDAAQEAFIKAVKGLMSSYKERGQFKCWLYRIAYREGLRIISKRGSGITVEALDDEITERIEDSAPQAPEQLATKEDKDALNRAIDKLPDNEKQVVLLRMKSGLSFSEIAEATDCPLNTALGRMNNAKKRLKKFLKGYKSENE